MERLSIASFLAAGHEYHLYVYEDVGCVPYGAIQKDAREILPSSWIFTDSRTTFAGLSDLFRYKLLLERGGWWVDTDTICLHALDSQDDYLFSTEPDLTISAGVIRVPSGSPVIARAWQLACSVDRNDFPWGAAGPALLARAVEEAGMTDKAVEPVVFYPLDWNQWADVLNSSLSWNFGPNTRAVHLWNSMWDLAGFDKNASYPSGCLYEMLKKRFLPS